VNLKSRSRPGAVRVSRGDLGRRGAGGARLDEFVGDPPVLTDVAPVEQLLTPDG
jgi:hypothetical protein